ncbi:unnamed protein product, partial [Amoebophrya sp. A120]
RRANEGRQVVEGLPWTEVDGLRALRPVPAKEGRTPDDDGENNHAVRIAIAISIGRGDQANAESG